MLINKKHLSCMHALNTSIFHPIFSFLTHLNHTISASQFAINSSKVIIIYPCLRKNFITKALILDFNFFRKRF